MFRLDCGELEYLKRFAECYQADPDFRKAYCQSPSALLRERGLSLEPACIEEFLPAIASNDAGFLGAWAQPLFLETMRKLQCQPVSDSRFEQWRRRQVKRVEAFYHVDVSHRMVYPPMAFEISKGCSGKCFFCCFDPPPLSGVFRYSEANRQLWRDVLGTSKQLVGPLLGSAGACYYATEPFDNPEYERLAEDYRDVTGFWPPLTTVKCLEDPKRIREHLRAIRADSDHPVFLRFSITSLRMLREVHAEYTPKELADVELVLNNPESTWKYSPAGRARKIAERGGHGGDRMADKFYIPGPTACVNGFVVNLVDRSIRLVSTCTPDEQNPHGYILFDSMDFQTSAEYERALEELIVRHMPAFPLDDSILAFNPGFRGTPTDNGFEFATDFMTRRVGGDASFSGMCGMIAEGRHTWRDICDRFQEAWITEMYLKPKLSALFDLGLLREPFTVKKQ